MGLFSASSSKSSSADNRAMASDKAIAAGGNSGNISRDIFGDIIFQPGGGFPWKPVLIGAAVLFVLWRIPRTRALIKRLIGVWHG